MDGLAAPTISIVITQYLAAGLAVSKKNVAPPVTSLS